MCSEFTFSINPSFVKVGGRYRLQSWSELLSKLRHRLTPTYADAALVLKVTRDENLRIFITRTRKLYRLAKDQFDADDRIFGTFLFAVYVVNRG